MSAPRVFIAHPAGLGDAAIESLKVEIEQAAQRENITAEFVLGRDDHKTSFALYGGWDGWGASVAEGMEYRGNTRAPRFDVIVVAPSVAVGKATAQIVQRALQMRKPVLVYLDGQFKTAREIVQTDPRDFKSGWAVVV